MSDFLSTISAASLDRVARAKRELPLDELRRRASDRPKRGRMSLHASGFDIIAEIKRNAPSAGILSNKTGKAARQMVAERGNAYARGGAAAISVLTEPTKFSGDLKDLTIAAESTPLPVMRKDFLVDEYQVYEARAHDATGVLLIARLLRREKIEPFIAAAEETRQFILLEIFGADELTAVEWVIKAVADRDVPLMIGVNARDLTDLKVDTERFATLAPQLPTEFPLVAESGLKSVADIRDTASFGYRLALVGTALMQSDNPASTLSKFVDTGRAAAKACVSR